MPGADLWHAVLAQRQHALLAGDVGDLGLGRLGDRHVLDPLAHGHHRVDADPAAVAAAGCSGCSRPARRPRCRRRPEARHSAQRLRRDHDRALLAVRAELAGQALGDDAVDGRGGEEGLDSHLREPGDRARGVVGVKRREHHVPGQRGLDRDPRGLGVADLADHDDVGVGAQDRAQAGGEVRPALRLTLIWLMPSSRYSTGSSIVMMFFSTSFSSPSAA